MATKCFSVVRGKAVRITQVNECGEVVEGGSYAVSDGFISVSLSADIESGDEFVQKNANGRLCINERSPDALKRLTVEIDWCQVDPELISLITGFAEVDDGATDVTGFRIQEGEFDATWALELWSGIGGDNCGTNGPEFGYFLLPFITGASLGDVTIENGAATFQTTGYTQGNSAWGKGPWDVTGTTSAPAPLVDDIGPTDHAHIEVVSLTPPTAQCGVQTIPSS